MLHKKLCHRLDNGDDGELEKIVPHISCMQALARRSPSPEQLNQAFCPPQSDETIPVQRELVPRRWVPLVWLLLLLLLAAVEETSQPVAMVTVEAKKEKILSRP